MRRGGSSLAKIVARDHMRIARQELGLLPGGQVPGPTVMPSVNLDPDGVLQGFFITLATDARHTEMYYALDQGEWTRYEPLQVIHLEHSQNSASTPSTMITACSTHPDHEPSTVHYVLSITERKLLLSRELRRREFFGKLPAGGGNNKFECAIRRSRYARREHMHACMHACMHTHIFTYTYAHAHMLCVQYVCMRACMHACTGSETHTLHTTQERGRRDGSGVGHDFRVFLHQRHPRRRTWSPDARSHAGAFDQQAHR